MVRVFCCDVSAVSEGDHARLYAMASRERRQRAEGYLRREDAVRCLAAEALLRYAVPGLEPERIQRGLGGKPCLEGVHFNLSHSGRWVALAVGDSPLGIDVECFKTGRDPQKLARRYFTEEERRYVGSSQERFLRVWTAKESRLKCLGVGLSVPLDSFSVLGLDTVRTWLLPGAVLSLCGRELPEAWEAVPLGRILSEETAR